VSFFNLTISNCFDADYAVTCHANQERLSLSQVIRLGPSSTRTGSGLLIRIEDIDPTESLAFETLGLDAKEEQDSGNSFSEHISCANVLKKRRKKMRRHKHKKRLRENRYKNKK